jgi:regulator of cell morphogenesis and NO signaling
MDETKIDWAQRSLAELATHIVAVHHGYCRRELPRLSELFAEAVKESGGRYATLADLLAGFRRVSRALGSHLLKEESILFPLIERIEAAQEAHTPPPTLCFGSVGNPIRMMVLEHSEAEVELQKMRVATRGFQPPEGAGPKLMELCRTLRAFDDDMTRHVELEDQSLFPRAVAAEQKALG